MTEETRNTRILPYEARRVRQTIDRLLSSKALSAEIALLAARAGRPDVSPFERYAGIALRDAGAGRLRELSAGCAVLLDRPQGSRLVRLKCASELNAEDVNLLVGVEDTVNRLIDIADAIEDSGPARPDKSYGVGISPLGSSFIPQQASWRSANVALPEIGPAERPDVGYFNELDWRILDHVSVTARPAFQASLLPNPHQSVRGITCPDGSDWDVRTRLAALIAQLELPLRCSVRFDANIPDRTVAISFTAPGATSFPKLAYDGANGRFADVGGRIDDIRIAYSLRVACLLAAVAFGSGRRIGQAVVTASLRDGSRPVLHARFDRDRYVRRTLPAIDAGTLSDPAIRFDTATIASLAAPDHLEYVRFDGESSLSWPDAGTRALRVEPHEDSRALPEGLRPLFHARSVSDIDTRHYFGPGSQAITEARIDSDDSVIAAVARLERVIDELEGRTATPAENDRARPLFCTNPLSRAMVSLLDDDFSIAEQAESFLRGGSVAEGPCQREIEYFRVPDALYHAHMGLSDLYERLGDITGAQAHADRCIALAPTSPPAYFRKADILAQQARYREAANVLSDGLRCAVSPRDCALLYYHLALILWNTGRKPQAAAVHVYAASLSGEYAEKARKVIVNLRRQPDSPVIVFASPLAARREMERARIPVAPSDEAKMLVVRAAIGLSCADAPAAAAPYAAALSTYFPNEPLIASACRSIIEGIPEGER